jgi:hypothetical protein
MQLLRKEVEGGFERFTPKWRDELATVQTSLDQHGSRFLSSYERIVSLQAWRVEILEHTIPDGALQFFLEAQNDALISHVAARMGSLRSALKALRSCIENVLACLYYKDHPVELQLWNRGAHRLGFQALYDYMGKHPLFDGISVSDSGLDLLSKEYATLSRAVHASAVGFRMTGGTASTMLWSSDIAKLGSWATRESRTILGLNLVLLVCFQDLVKGTKKPALRKAVSFSVRPPRQSSVKSRFGITLYS